MQLPAIFIVKELRLQNSEEIGQARHVIEPLDEETTVTNISGIEALNVIKYLGHAIDNTKVYLIKNSAVDKIYWEILSGKVFFEVDAGTGELLSFSDCTEYGSKSSEVDSENAIEVARQKIVAISELPGDIGEPILESRESRWGTLCRVFWKQAKGGITVENGYMSVDLDTSGRIRQLRKYWQDIEMDIQANVTKDEAIKIAQEKVSLAEFPSLLLDRIEKAENVTASLIIEKPYNPLDTSKPILGQHCLVWKVIFESGTEGSFENVQLSIDANSGDLVGVDFTK